MSQDLKPSRELDASVAEKVMGCKVLWQRATTTGPYCGCNCDDGFQEGPHSDPNKFDANLKDYSTDIKAAWEVVEALRKRGVWLNISNSDNGYMVANNQDGLVLLGWKKFDCKYWDCDDVSKLPHSICLAALEAVGAKIEK